MEKQSKGTGFRSCCRHTPGEAAAGELPVVAALPGEVGAPAVAAPPAGLLPTAAPAVVAPPAGLLPTAAPPPGELGEPV